MQDKNDALNREMDATDDALDMIHQEIEARKERYREQETQQEERWRELDQSPDDINMNALTEQRTVLPRVGRHGSKSPLRGQSRGGFVVSSDEEEDRVGNLTIRQEARVRYSSLATNPQLAFRLHCSFMAVHALSYAYSITLTLTHPSPLFVWLCLRGVCAWLCVLVLVLALAR
jgi:hypothetical protein